ncbi:MULTISPECIES: class III lanthipeptide [Streptomyces]|uniref:Class III lanthipeptide n=1 Tax=Streptomyces lonegramiae TaxID=3075524 RepID=A0ABU2XMB5_9ACTN|nr:class III lanthipeptide [Streptomyces sp. DSM 41529]MDT0547056.1 class III lanthipeptide [Streptomyces sp. DSM 41529]
MSRVLALQSLEPAETEVADAFPTTMTITTSNSHLSVFMDCSTTVTRAVE